MVLRSGIIIPFQYRDAKKLLMIGVPEENRDLSIFDLKNVVRAAFGIYNFEFRNKKIGFNIPDELLLLYLAQRHDLTNFVVEIGHSVDDTIAAATSFKDPLCFEPSSSSSQKRKATQVVNNNNEHSDDQSSNLEPPSQRIRISGVFAVPPPSESLSQSSEESVEIVPKTEIEMPDDFNESVANLEDMLGGINCSKENNTVNNSVGVCNHCNNSIQELLRRIETLEETFKQFTENTATAFAVNGRVLRENLVYTKQIAKKTQKVFGHVKSEEEVEIAKHLPLNSIDEFIAFDDKLETQEYISAMKSHLFIVKASKGSVDNVFKSIMTDDCCEYFNLDGNRGRKAFRDTKLFQEVFRDVFPDLAEEKLHLQLRQCISKSHNRNRQKHFQSKKIT